MNSSSNLTPQIAAILAQIEKFGFKFFGYGENNDPLVIAPNGQVIPLKVAYEFVQQQIQNSTTNKQGGIESLPLGIAQIPDSKPMDVNFEKTPEKESSLETKPESQQNIQTQVSTNPVQNAPISNTQNSVTPKMPMPFDDGFKIKTFDPTDIDQTQEFVKQNSTATNTSSKKWLAAQFEKFLKEYQQKSLKKAS